MLDGVLRDLYRVFVLFFRVNRYPNLLPKHLQLFNCRGAIHVRRHEKGFPRLLLSMLASLPEKVVLPDP